MRRRDFLNLTLAAGSTALLPSCRDAAHRGPPAAGRLLVVAFDGLDPRIAAGLMQAGRMPNLARLSEQGSLTSLATCSPPHTPVAFSSIISGTDPGTHHIFDFIHRDPHPVESQAAVRPYFSTAEALPPESQWTIPLGGWQLPLDSGTTVLKRCGPAFWDYLVQAGIDTDVYFLPASYPPQAVEGPGRFRCIGGMGTPDLLGSYGEFTLFTPDAPPQGRQVDGGRLVRLALRDHRGAAMIDGPENFLLAPDPSGKVARLQIPLNVVRDPVAAVARIDVGGRPVLLNEGEWSGWVPVDFATGFPGSAALSTFGARTSVHGMVRLFLKRVHPKFELYVTPINIDPRLAATPISTPESFAAELARTGRFYTLGIPEDTKALTHGALTEDQFLDQVDLVMKEHVQHFGHALNEFRDGCLFFYFGSPDLVQHMFFRDRDPEHPGRVPAEAADYGRVVDDLYVRVDEIVGQAMRHLGPEDTLIVLSDHGFTSFRRGFNLNTWLLENDFIKLIDPGRQDRDAMFRNVRWDGTRAYGLGLNGLYLNLRGREKYGRVKEVERRGVVDEIAEKLIELRDPTGAAVVRRVDVVEDIYPAADPGIAPDLIIGYADGYRVSWDSVLGTMPRAMVEDNLARWSGTHLIAADVIPGILATNRPVVAGNPTIRDIAPTILNVFGIDPPPIMTGRPLLAST